MKLVYYIYRKQRYLDFQTLQLMYDKSRSDLYRHLYKSSIKTVHFNNKLLYNWDDILRDTQLLEHLDFAAVIKEFS